MHVVVLLLGEQRVVALDATALHVLVPAGLDVGFHQRRFALARRVKLQLLHLVLHKQVVKFSVTDCNLWPTNSCFYSLDEFTFEAGWDKPRWEAFLCYYALKWI